MSRRRGAGGSGGGSRGGSGSGAGRGAGGGAGSRRGRSTNAQGTDTGAAEPDRDSESPEQGGRMPADWKTFVNFQPNGRILRGPPMMAGSSIDMWAPDGGCEDMLIREKALNVRKRQADSGCRVSGCGRQAPKAPFLCSYHSSGEFYAVAVREPLTKKPRWVNIKLCQRLPKHWDYLKNFTRKKHGKFNVTCRPCCVKASSYVPKRAKTGGKAAGGKGSGGSGSASRSAKRSRAAMQAASAPAASASSTPVDTTRRIEVVYGHDTIGEIVVPVSATLRYCRDVLLPRLARPPPDPYTFQLRGSPVDKGHEPLLLASEAVDSTFGTFTLHLSPVGATAASETAGSGWFSAAGSRQHPYEDAFSTDAVGSDAGAARSGSVYLAQPRSEEAGNLAAETLPTLGGFGAVDGASGLFDDDLAFGGMDDFLSSTISGLDPVQPAPTHMPAAVYASFGARSSGGSSLVGLAARPGVAVDALGAGAGRAGIGAGHTGAGAGAAAGALSGPQDSGGGGSSSGHGRAVAAAATAVAARSLHRSGSLTSSGMVGLLGDLGGDGDAYGPGAPAGIGGVESPATLSGTHGGLLSLSAVDCPSSLSNPSGHTCDAELVARGILNPITGVIAGACRVVGCRDEAPLTGPRLCTYHAGDAVFVVPANSGRHMREGTSSFTRFCHAHQRWEWLARFSLPKACS